MNQTSQFDPALNFNHSRHQTELHNKELGQTMTKITTNNQKGAEEVTSNSTSTSRITTTTNLTSFSSLGPKDSNAAADETSSHRVTHDKHANDKLRNKSNIINSSLRPKFGILKHKTEIINQTTIQSRDLSAVGRQTEHKQKATTPSWFFNIPTTRSPFPEFESKLPPEDQ